jgi:ketosteroid isomerase-like protein
MKSLASAVGLLIPALLLPLAAPGDERATPVQKQIIALEQRLNDALSRADAKVIEEIWADDFVFVFPSGKVSNKSERLARLGPGTAAPELLSSLDEVSVRTFGEVAVAIVKTTWQGTADGKPVKQAYVATHVWARRGGIWRLVSAQVAQSATVAPST